MITLISAAMGIAKMTGLDKKIGHLLGGDNGEAVAAKVMDIAQKVTGKSNILDAKSAIELSPELALNFEEKVLEHEGELTRLAFEDRKDARQMQVAALTQKDTFSKRFIYYFSIGWSLFAMIYVAAITFFPIPEESVRFADTVLGFLLATAIGGIMQFFFGSSEGNERRAETELHASVASRIGS